MLETEAVGETLDSDFILTRVMVREDLIACILRESFQSYISFFLSDSVLLFIIIIIIIIIHDQQHLVTTLLSAIASQLRRVDNRLHGAQCTALYAQWNVQVVLMWTSAIRMSTVAEDGIQGSVIH
jgi:hypothetical protein